jgi:hypothetical protein
MVLMPMSKRKMRKSRQVGRRQSLGLFFYFWFFFFSFLFSFFSGLIGNVMT